MFFSQELLINEFAGKDKRQMDRKFSVTMHTDCHFQLTSVKIKKNVAVDEKSSFIFCTQFDAQIAGNGILKLPDFKIFWGTMPPDVPRLMGLTAPCSYSRLFFSNQLSTSNFIEIPVNIFLLDTLH